MDVGSVNLGNLHLPNCENDYGLLLQCFWVTPSWGALNIVLIVGDPAKPVAALIPRLLVGNCGKMIEQSHLLDYMRPDG